MPRIAGRADGGTWAYHRAMSATQFSPPADRNKQPILEVLLRLLPPRGAALEIASGTGQHAAWFATGLPGWTWQPTDRSDKGFESIATWSAEADAAGVLTPKVLDVTATAWPLGARAFDLIYCANMLHISPWATCAGLMQGAARHLTPEGMLIVYGPFLEDEVSTADGNLAFDQSLRQRNPAWGIRRREDVVATAVEAGLRLRERVAMPADNLMLGFGRGT